MTDPSGIRAARDACRRLGFELAADDSDGRASALARPGADARSIHSGDPRPIAIVPVADPTPAAVLSAVGEAASAGRTCLLVPAGPTEATELTALLRAPTGAKSVDDAGCRTLHSGVDRIHLDGGGLALYDAGDDFGRPTFEWHEELATPAGDRTGTDDRRLVLSANGEPAAVLPGTGALGCPGPDPAAFAHRYRREADRLFHVYGSDHEVGVFSGVRAMRERGFHPVPAPVVPERHLPGPAGEAWAVLDGHAGTVRTDGGTVEL
jgi:hypothetical protein